MNNHLDIPWLPESPVGFPDPREALAEPNGLVAAGGELSPRWLLEAYAHGIFPWFNSDQSPLLWWSPDPRGVIRPGALTVRRSFRKRLRNGGFRVTADKAFRQVIKACAIARRREGTWITPSMQRAYIGIHLMGVAHSIEVWQDQRLVGGLYGVSLGRVFCGESMFSLVPDASKIALYALSEQLNEWQFVLIDCQMMTDHLASLGAFAMAREDFLAILTKYPLDKSRRGSWSETFSMPSIMRQSSDATADTQGASKL